MNASIHRPETKGGEGVRLGRLNAAGPLMLAPIAGFTDSPFRRIARRYGAGFVVTELISAEGIVRMNRKTAGLLRFAPEERPLAVQIFGNRPDVVAEAAARVEEMGPDCIDLNMGCPARRVCGSGSGAALLLEPKKIYAIVSSVAKRVRLPVSAKIRIGWDERTLTYRETVRALEDAGVSFITVHGRTKAQGYGGTADWNTIAEIASASRVPIVGNGDIRSHEQAWQRLASSGCRAVMIGRGALGNPWIFSGEAPGLPEIAAQILDHLDMMLSHYGDGGLILMRKHAAHYLRRFHGARHLRSLLVTAEDVSTFREILRAIRP